MSLTGSCHCGKVAFQVMGEIPETLTRCTCSFCAKRGGLHVYYRPDQFTLTTPFGEEGVYRWGNGAVAHHFCPDCGCFTFSWTVPTRSQAFHGTAGPVASA